MDRGKYREIFLHYIKAAERLNEARDRFDRISSLIGLKVADKADELCWPEWREQADRAFELLNRYYLYHETGDINASINMARADCEVHEMIESILYEELEKVVKSVYKASLPGSFRWKLSSDSESGYRRVFYENMLKDGNSDNLSPEEMENAYSMAKCGELHELSKIELK